LLGALISLGKTLQAIAAMQYLLDSGVHAPFCMLL